MSTYIGFNLNSNRQIEHFQTIENRYGINSDGGKFLFGQIRMHFLYALYSYSIFYQVKN